VESPADFSGVVYIAFGAAAISLVDVSALGPKACATFESGPAVAFFLRPA